MQYKGNLYGKVDNKYMPLAYTATDFDLLYQTVKTIADGSPKVYGIIAIEMARITLNSVEDYCQYFYTNPMFDNAIREEKK